MNIELKDETMKTLNVFKIMLVIVSVLVVKPAGYGQGASRMIQVLDTATLRAQFQYIHDRTLIYENYRAIREDVFQKIRGNSMDSLLKAKNRIMELSALLTQSNDRIDSLNTVLYKTKNELESAIKNKNSIKMFGFQTNKIMYKTIMWSVTTGLTTLLIFLFLVFKRTRIVTHHIRKDYEETRDEFEAYKKSSRERYENLVVSHHKEIMKLKGN